MIEVSGCARGFLVYGEYMIGPQPARRVYLREEEWTEIFDISQPRIGCRRNYVPAIDHIVGSLANKQDYIGRKGPGSP